MHYLYWIHLPGMVLSEGYIGVSVDAERRWKTHKLKTKNKHLQNALQLYGDRIVFEVLLEGDETYCYILEALLRPIKNVGWNIAEGGNKPPIAQKGKKVAHDYDKWLANQKAAKTGKQSTIETKQKLTDIHKTRWADPNIRKRMLAARNPHPTAYNKGKPDSELTRFKKQIAQLFRHARERIQ